MNALHTVNLNVCTVFSRRGIDFTLYTVPHSISQLEAILFLFLFPRRTHSPFAAMLCFVCTATTSLAKLYVAGETKRAIALALGS